MATLRVLSAGAAQAVSERMIDAFRRETGHEVIADFGAVGAMQERVKSGEAVDVIILTRALIENLVQAQLIVPDSQIDLGTVGTGVAVRAGIAIPVIATAQALRGIILSAKSIVCPDPAIATAGKIVMGLVEKLSVAAEARERLRFFPNGYAAMKWLAASGTADDLGITQVTEILPNNGVSYVGPLPDEFQMKAVYSAGLAQHASEPALARDFIGRYASPSARALLIEAGYEL